VSTCLTLPFPLFRRRLPDKALRRSQEEGPGKQGLDSQGQQPGKEVIVSGKG
jgi:hypothetical protein